MKKIALNRAFFAGSLFLCLFLSPLSYANTNLIETGKCQQVFSGSDKLVQELILVAISGKEKDFEKLKKKATKEDINKAFLTAVRSRQTEAVEFLSNKVITFDQSFHYNEIIFKALYTAVQIEYVEVYEVLIHLSGYDHKSLTYRAGLLAVGAQRGAEGDKKLLKLLIEQDVRQIAIYRAIRFASEVGNTAELEVLINGLKNSVNYKRARYENMTDYDKDSMKALKGARLNAEQKGYHDMLELIDSYIPKLVIHTDKIQ